MPSTERRVDMSVALAPDPVDRQPQPASAIKTFIFRAWQQYGGVFLLLLIGQIVTYGYFFTTLIFTNHTFPNSWLYEYPSFKTRGEGRWLADLIIFLQGGTGVQPFQMMLGVAIHAINGILFARFLGLERRMHVLAAGLFLCLYPAFLDNYSFSADHLTFALGDCFALCGISLCVRSPRTIWNALAAVVLLSLCIGCYQPKIALIGVLALIALLRPWLNPLGRRPVTLRAALLGIAWIGGICAGGALLYFAISKATMSGPAIERGHLNSADEIRQAILAAYRATFDCFTSKSDYLPTSLRYMPLLCIVVGSALVLVRCARSAAGLLVAIAALSLFPVALRASYIINSNTWVDAGRIVFVNGYALLFFVICAFHWRPLRQFALLVMAIFIYFFVVTGTQESSAAAIKTVYDLNMINRIVARVEGASDDLYAKKRPLVVVGHYPELPRYRYVRNPNKGNQSQAQTFAFEFYRQQEILNFYLGRDLFLTPTPEEKASAIAAARSHRAWPASDAVFLDHDTVVIVLEKPAK